jgi:hypothetical protein
MQRTWVEEQGLRRTKDGIDELRKNLSQMLAKRELEKEREDHHEGRSQGFVDCLRNSLQSVERAMLELDVYDAQFKKVEEAHWNDEMIDAALSIVRETDEEKLERCELELRRLVGLKERCSRWSGLLTQIDKEIEKIKEIAKMLGYNTYDVELVEERCTTQLVLARTPSEARDKGILKQGVVADIDDSVTARQDPRIRLNGRTFSKVELEEQ